MSAKPASLEKNVSKEICLSERVSGCLIGAAVGEALAAPYIGEWGHAVPASKNLLAAFQPFSLMDDHPAGQFTDKTQLMLAGVEAIVVAEGIRPSLVAQAMSDLWATGRLISPNVALARSLAKFHRTGDWLSSGAPEGYADSGPAARSAAFGLYFLNHSDLLPECVAELARLTHSDERSVAGAVAVAQAAQVLATNPDTSNEVFAEAIAEAVEPIEASFAELIRQVPDLAAMPDRSAVRAMASAGIFDREFDRPIITSFVIPTVLASLWCVMRFAGDWCRATASAIRLGGNVDSLGAIVGALAGVRLGAQAIPRHLKASVQCSGGIERLADDYFRLIRPEIRR